MCITTLHTIVKKKSLKLLIIFYTNRIFMQNFKKRSEI